MKKIITLISLLITLNVISQNINLVTDFAINGIKTITTDGTELDQINLVDYDQNSFLIYSKVFSGDDTLENVIYKINTDGTFDTNFGEDGKLTLPNHAGRFFVYKQNSNDLIIFFTRVSSINSGTQNNERIIMKYSTSGNLDNSFGVNGEVKIATGNSDGTGVSNIVILNDDTILFSDSEKFIKYNSNGTLDTSYGVNGAIQGTNIGNMTNSNNGNILFYNSTRIENKDYNNNTINSFGDNGVHTFPSQSDYIMKAYSNRISYMDLGELPSKFYDLNTNGNLNMNFNSSGSIDLETDNNTLEYIENFEFINDKFYFMGSSIDEIPFLMCYDVNGNLIKLNNQNSYKESTIVSGGFYSAIEKDGFLFTSGYQYDDASDKENFIVAKYDNAESTTLSTSQFENDAIKTIISKKFIEFRGFKKINRINLFDLNGKLIEQTNNSNKVKIENLNTGIYIAHVKMNNKHTKVVKVFIK